MRLRQLFETTQLNEASLVNSELRKHAGKYLKILLRKIEDGELIELTPAGQEKHGTKEVVLNKKAANNLLKAYFGTPKMPEMDDMNLAANNDLIPEQDPNKVELTTTTGEKVLLSDLQKTAEYKGGKSYNTGDVAEGALGAAIYAKFMASGEEITEQTVYDVLAQMTNSELVGKNNLKGSAQGTRKNDNVYYNLSLASGSYKALVGAASSGEVPPQIKGAVRSAVTYANNNAGVQAAVTKIVTDENANKITVLSDGVSDQKGTKADLFLDIDGTTVNLLSLKAGSVKQFGQSSGYKFDAIDNFFNSTFGVNVNKEIEAEFEQGNALKSMDAIHKAYAQVGAQIQRELSGDNDANEARFVERLYKGINQHATGGQQGTSMVVLKDTPNAPGYVELQFGEPLRKAMENIDLQVEVIAPGGKAPAKILVNGVSEKDGAVQNLLTMRSNFKSEGAGGYVRNIVEMGKLLKTIAAIEEKIIK